MPGMDQQSHIQREKVCPGSKRSHAPFSFDLNYRPNVAATSCLVRRFRATATEDDEPLSSARGFVAQRELIFHVVAPKLEPTFIDMQCINSSSNNQ